MNYDTSILRHTTRAACIGKYSNILVAIENVVGFSDIL
jgi:hypothetical protein